MTHTRNYFTLPHPLWMLAVGLLLYLLTMATVAPDKIPAFLGPLGGFATYVGKNYPNFCIHTCVITVVVHVLEGAYAGKLCHDRDMTTGATIKWVLSTAVFGFPSLFLRLIPALKTKKIA